MRIPVVIDVEASGFGRGGYPIEVGVVLPDGTAHCYLIAPVRGWTSWDQDAEAVHGINREVLETYGRPAREVAERLNALLGGKTVYSDAWAFDMPWLGKLFDAVNIEQRFRVASLQELMSPQQIEGWRGLRQGVEEEFDLKRHRASGDARILQETYRRSLGLAA